MFNIDNNISVNVSGSKFLTGDAIHEVTFTGIAKADVGDYPVLELRFEGEGGEFVERFFEPKPEAMVRAKNQFDGENPSGVEQMLGKMRSYIAELNPTLHEQIEKGTKKFQAKTWDELRSFMGQALSKQVGTKTLIKLLNVKNKSGYVNAVTPAFPMSISREGKLYLQAAFIGDKASFTKREQKDIDARKTAPTSMGGDTQTNNASAPATQKTGDDFSDFDFDELG